MPLRSEPLVVVNASTSVVCKVPCELCAIRHVPSECAGCAYARRVSYTRIRLVRLVRPVRRVRPSIRILLVALLQNDLVTPMLGDDDDDDVGDDDDDVDGDVHDDNLSRHGPHLCFSPTLLPSRR